MSWDESAPPTVLRRPLQMNSRHLIALPTAGKHPEVPSWAAHLHLPQPPCPYQLPPACSSADAHVFGCGYVSVLPQSGGCARSRESLYEVTSLLRAVESAFALTSALGRHLTGLTHEGRDDDGQGPVESRQHSVVIAMSTDTIPTAHDRSCGDWSQRNQTTAGVAGRHQIRLPRTDLPLTDSPGSTGTNGRA